MVRRGLKSGVDERLQDEDVRSGVVERTDAVRIHRVVEQGQEDNRFEERRDPFDDRFQVCDPCQARRGNRCCCQLFQS